MSEFTKRSEAALRQFSQEGEDLNDALARLFREAGYEWREFSLSIEVNRDTKYWEVFTSLPYDEMFTLDNICLAKNVDYADRACGRGPVDVIDLNSMENDREDMRNAVRALEEKGLVEKVDEAEWQMTTLGLKTLDQHEQHQRRPLV